MRLLATRLAYRIGAPLAHLWWELWRAGHTGSKCVITSGGDVLLVRHTYGDRRRWDLPGGFVRRGERPAVAARRELHEELGVAVDELRPLGELALRLGRRTDRVHYFAGELADRGAVAADPREIAEVAWFAAGALPGRAGAHVVAVVGWIGPVEALASGATDPGSPDRG